MTQYISKGAPEKIYLSDFTDTTEAVFYVKSNNTKKTDIEYTCTDAFIDKAVEYILTHISDMHILGGSCRMDECIIEDFKKYMKGE